MHNFQGMGGRTMHNLQGKVGRTMHHYVLWCHDLRQVTSLEKKEAILSSLEVVVNELMNTSTFFENRVFLPKKSIC